MDGSLVQNSAAGIAADFFQLQREYRNMEQNRKAYTEDSQNIIRRQQAAIAKLRLEEEALLSELAMETRHAASKASGGHSSKISQIQEQGDLYTQRLAIETKNLEELNKAIKVMKSKILQQRKAMGGINAAKENQKTIQKQIRILENRLDKALVKFNEALAHNKNLRETIDNLRRERVVFDKIYRKLEKELQEKKQQMANVIEQSNQAYEARDQAQMEITALEHINTKEAKEHEQQLEELDRLIDADKKRKDIILKEQNRDSQRGDLSMEEEQKLKKRATKGAWSMAKEKANVKLAEMQAQSYEEAFNKIKAATGISDIDQLVSSFIQNEEHNFSMFNFVNEQNNELESLEEQIQQLKEEEVKYTQESGDDVNQHKQLLNDLEKKLQQTQAALVKYDNKFHDATKTMNALKIGIQSIFSKTECDASAMSELLSDTQVTDANMMQFLGIIEQQTNEILQLWAAYSRRHAESKNDVSMTSPLGSIPGSQSFTTTPKSPQEHAQVQAQALVSILGQGPITPMGQDTLQINPPNLEDYSSEDVSDTSDSELCPLTHEQLKIKTMKAIHKRAAAGASVPKDTKSRNALGKRTGNHYHHHRSPTSAIVAESIPE